MNTTVKLHADIIAGIDQCAERYGVGRAEMIRVILMAFVQLQKSEAGVVQR